MSSSKGRISKCKIHPDEPIFTKSAVAKLLRAIKKDERIWTFKFILNNHYPNWTKEKEISDKYFSSTSADWLIWQQSLFQWVSQIS